MLSRDMLLVRVTFALNRFAKRLRSFDSHLRVFVYAIVVGIVVVVVVSGIFLILCTS